MSRDPRRTGYTGGEDHLDMSDRTEPRQWRANRADAEWWDRWCALAQADLNAGIVRTPDEYRAILEAEEQGAA